VSWIAIAALGHNLVKADPPARPETDRRSHTIPNVRSLAKDADFHVIPMPIHFQSPRSAHRSVVPIAALPLLVTTITGIAYSLLEHMGIEADWVLDLHYGHYGPIDLSGIYPLLLGLCVLILLGTGVTLWLQTGRRSKPAD